MYVSYETEFTRSFFLFVRAFSMGGQEVGVARSTELTFAHKTHTNTILDCIQNTFSHMSIRRGPNHIYNLFLSITSSSTLYIYIVSMMMMMPDTH